MSELATLARPYAAAVFKRAKETDATANWSQSLAFMSAVLKNEDITVVADNPKVSKDRLLALILDICHEYLNEENENFLKLLAHNNRLGLLPSIVKIFEAYKAEDEGYVEVDVLTAYALSKEAKQNFAVTLEKTLGKKIHMNVALDKSLIGGFLVRAGDRVIDGSIRGRLQHMQKALQ
ncbi:F0F1 ATP synthase subunit delta [Methylobacter sp. S3L5C]|uniref:F0F1 ATP synthase subunit delta n=1 Tax=Methylobacter sp. S3L5C TaxID=2839024 RepID=UPI001FAE116C|nr:F0F1 ATP synthase subunit delta [Methylobacter sp. S3L5C]UOA09716.1 F0F1 ATP synthase subunit delta [Methylobacter sp. S3L5C]